MKKQTIELNKVNKIYENGIQAVFDFSINVKEKEFIALVGPSGCGKSTTLRMVAGLEDISYGELKFDNVVMNSVQPKNRDIAMVFQNYALYPHMNIYQNMAFSLKMKKISGEEIDKKINWAADILGLSNYLNRRPKDLSGGQRQRVALGRAIVRKPRLFLMDEPLSNLDAKLRAGMRAEIKELHKRLGATTIYVTHDQVEAMTMADRIVVMNDGFVQQIGTPTELFNSPSNLFVAKFIGTPEINMIDGVVEKNTFKSVDGKIVFKIPKGILDEKYFGKKVILAIRPYDISVEEPVKMTYKDTEKEVKIINTENLGTEMIVHAELENKQRVTFISRGRYHELNKKIKIYFNKSKMIFFDKETGINISGNLNDDTKNALKVINERQYDYDIKNELLKLQANDSSWTSKIVDKIKSIKSKGKKNEK